MTDMFDQCDTCFGAGMVTEKGKLVVCPTCLGVGEF